jgi:endonuclease YncB( thermonuclease family)
MFLTLTAAAAIAVCPPHGPRQTCVVDGDTFWWRGEKIRIAEIDAPEIRGRCEQERQLAVRARDRLVVLLNRQRITIERTGTDRYGRTLARVDGIGEQLIDEQLATRWPRRKDWCR